MILEKNAAFAQPFEWDMSGALLLAEGADFDAFRVHAVIAGSPAAQAGLVEGDRIAAIDGRAASGFRCKRSRNCSAKTASVRFCSRSRAAKIGCLT